MNPIESNEGDDPASRKARGNPSSLYSTPPSFGSSLNSSPRLFPAPFPSSLIGGSTTSLSSVTARKNLPPLSLPHSLSQLSANEKCTGSDSGDKGSKDKSVQQRLSISGGLSGSRRTSPRSFVNDSEDNLMLNGSINDGVSGVHGTSSSIGGTSARKSSQAGFSNLASFFSPNTPSHLEGTNGLGGDNSSTCSSSSSLNGSFTSLHMRDSTIKEEGADPQGVENASPSWGHLAPLPYSPRPYFPTRKYGLGHLHPLSRRSFILQVSGKPFRASEKTGSHTCSVTFTSKFPGVALEAGEAIIGPHGEDRLAETPITSQQSSHLPLEPRESILLPNRRGMNVVSILNVSQTPRTEPEVDELNVSSSGSESKEVKDNSDATEIGNSIASEEGGAAGI